MNKDDQNPAQSTAETAHAPSDTPMMLTDATGTVTPVPYDPALLAFVHEGTEIRNPYVSPDGRTLVSPLIYGFVEYHTGGGCMALMRPHTEGRSLYLVQDGAYIADPQDWRECVISLSDEEGDELAYCDLGAVPSSSEIGHQNAAENPVCPDELSIVPPEILKDRYRKWAIDNLANDDQEFDEKASVNLCEGGAFVQAWIWVPSSRLPAQPDSTI
ncbi:hypothetical protein [Pseudomonas sp. PS02290]|uniref:hypothetical protein n=1 Tax=Pseudomonas sp. PS02290 TaxID=2991430 RepID=UPI00249AF5A2|nr:hypothetical protein [Pseudomonas sp. PS02290]